MIIAEAGVNHNGDPGLAFELLDAAAQAGADVVKFQTFRPEEVISRNAPKADYQAKTTNKEESQLEMARRLALSEDDFMAIAERCRKRNIRFLSTPYDFFSMDFLVHGMGLTTLKLPSGEITNAPYLLRAARTGSKIILSTGMSTLDEVETALSVLAFGYGDPSKAPHRDAFRRALSSPAGQTALKDKVTLLHCTTEYPTPFSDVNLKAMDSLGDAFGLPVGLSDHTPGIAVAMAAAGRGAVIIEKHFTLDRGMEGPDHKASLEPGELKNMVDGIRAVEQALGDGEKVPAPSEIKNIAIARRSLVAGAAIKEGEAFTEENLCVKRPGDGVSPMRYWEWLGRTAKRDFEADELIDE